MILPDELPEIGDLIEPKPEYKGQDIFTTLVLSKPIKEFAHKYWTAIGYDLVRQDKINITFDINSGLENPETCFFWVKISNVQAKKR